MSDLRAAGGAILVAHTIKTVFALAMLAPWLDLAHLASGGELVRLATDAIRRAPDAAAFRWLAIGLLGYLLLGPLLTQYVLAALSGRTWTAAASRYGRALALYAGCFASVPLIAVGSFVLSGRLAVAAPPSLETPVRLVPFALAAAWLLWISTIHDLAAAQLAARGAPPVTHALRDAVRCRWKWLVVHGGFALGAMAIHALGDVLGRVLWTAPGLAAAQALALGAAFLRAAWLRVALTRTDQPIDASR